MKLHSIEIQNFRAIENGKFDFSDILSKPRTVSLLVGPNGSGKTSILDAIHIVIRTLENPSHPRLREGLEFSPAEIVRGRGKQAKIEFTCSIEDDEAQAITEVYRALNLNEPFLFDGEQLPLHIPSQATWEFPSVHASDRMMFSVLKMPRTAANVLGAREKAAQAVKRNVLPLSIIERIGSVCYLDQRRSFRIAKTVSFKEDTEKLSKDDVLSWLHIYFQRHQRWNEDKYGESYWTKIKRLFEQVCYPAELVGLESGPDIDTLILKRHGVEYDLSQMSSGEQQILRILVGLVAETAQNSIVLIDEVELHLHPAWQRKLIFALREDHQSNNQYIFTTHSPFVRQLFFEDEIIDLGDLGENQCK